MHLFIATLSTETNTFCPIPTALQDYKDYYFRHGTATQEKPNLMTEALHIWRSKAEKMNWQVTESLAAIAEPAGPTTATAYEELKGIILKDIKAAQFPDVILLQLHGAMVADNINDCEGDITQSIRKLCPNAVIGIELDLHCHITQTMMDACDLIISFKEYPHDDASDRAVELFDLALRTHNKEIKPIMATFSCNMVALYLTKGGAMHEFVQHMKAMEQKVDILSVSLAHGFPWADHVDVDARVLVISNDSMDIAKSMARELGELFFFKRNELIKKYTTLDFALDTVVPNPKGPIVLADMSDNSGAGAPGDSTYVLQEILNRGIENVVSGIYWDPIAVRFCQNAGEGAEIQLRLGGKVEVASGMPIDIKVKIIRIIEGLGQHLGSGLEPLGTMVWLQAENDLDLVINDLRTQVYHPEAFEQLGITLAKKSLIVVKSLFHFYSPFAKIASDVIFTATPGRVNPNTDKIPYKVRSLNYWPRVDNPFCIDSENSYQ